jgi:tripeptide aminopeptidase
LDAKFNAAVRAAADEENKRWNSSMKVTVSPELVGLRPPGQTPESSPIVQTALAVSKALGLREILREGSTDSNVPMNMNIPAITISGGGAGTGAHSLNETFDTANSWKGTQRALLLAIALAR